MKRRITKIIRNILAVICFIIAFIGGFVPVLQGWMFFLAGYLLIDFKKKQQFERRILIILKKSKIGRRIYHFWMQKKQKHQDSIQKAESQINEQRIKSVGNLFHSIKMKSDKTEDNDPDGEITHSDRDQHKG